jgi:peptidoglycan hydrolase-like protein with peptidoglycan-binding domain
MPAKKSTAKNRQQTRNSKKSSSFALFIKRLTSNKKVLFVVAFALIGVTSLLIVRAYTRSAAEWNKYAPPLRQCESGGNYSINTGNGYYGAYQFDISTWQGYDGYKVYGYQRADLAPKNIQDLSAYQLFQHRGLQPWGCASFALSNPYYGPEDSTGGSATSSRADAVPASTTNPTGTDCHSYVLQYDPGNYYPCVRHLQVDLGIRPDGYFGPATRQAVINKQAAHGLNQTGTVDAATWCVIHTDLPGCVAPAPAPTPPPASQAVQGRLFRDDNGNGAREGGEPLIGNAGSCGNYVNVDASVVAAGHHVNADRCMDGPFYFIPTGTGSVTITAHAPAGWSHTNGNSRTVNVSAGQHVDVQWFGMRPTPAPAPPTGSSSRAIIGVGSSRCLDVAGMSRSPGAQVHLWDCHGQANQQWKMLSNKTIQVYGNMCLDIVGNNTRNGADIVIWPCHNGANQQWYYPGDGTIRSVLNGKCLDVAGYGTGNGSKIHMWDCHGQSNQLWR